MVVNIIHERNGKLCAEWQQVAHGVALVIIFQRYRYSLLPCHSMSGGCAGFERRDRDAAEISLQLPTRQRYGAGWTFDIRDIIPLQLKPYDDAVRSVIKGG